MASFLKWLLFLPIAAIIVIFAVVNRQSVGVVIDPFGSDIPGLRFEAPLFAVIFLSAAIGVVAGGVVTWIRQGHYRRSLREVRTEIASLRAERDRLVGEQRAASRAIDRAA